MDVEGQDVVTQRGRIPPLEGHLWDAPPHFQATREVRRFERIVANINLVSVDFTVGCDVLKRSWEIPTSSGLTTFSWKRGRRRSRFLGL